MLLNSMNMASATPTATSVLCVWCTTTLSMMTCVNSGVVRPTNWMATEASSTSRQMDLYFSNCGMNQRKPKPGRSMLPSGSDAPAPALAAPTSRISFSNTRGKSATAMYRGSFSPARR